MAEVRSSRATVRLRASAHAFLALLVGCQSSALDPADAARPTDAPPSDALSSTDAPRPDGGDPLDRDLDRDGWTRREGDCDDSIAGVNPGAFDDPATDLDDDCDGMIAVLDECESSLAIDAAGPEDAARSLGLCRFADESSMRWGVIGARWTMPDGTAIPVPLELQHGLLDRLGTSAIAPRAGERMLALSSGVARGPEQPGFTTDCDLFDTRAMPPPLDAGGRGCGEGFAGAFDAIALELRLRVPSNANAFTIDSAFFTYEYPDYVCQTYNDFFVVTLEPRATGRPDDNVVFDNQGRYVSVNSSFLGACEPGTHAGRHFECPIGVEPLRGTGFDRGHCGGGDPNAAAGGSTGWLRTSVSVQAGSIITLRIAIWDEGDTNRDSLVLLDRFRWLIDDPGTNTIPF